MVSQASESRASTQDLVTRYSDHPIVVPFLSGIVRKVAEYHLIYGVSVKLIISLRSHECPDCGSYLVRRSHMRGFVEQAICRLFFVQPYRCDDCELRFFLFRTHSERKLAL